MQQLSFFIILVAALGLLITERIRNDLVAVLIILALYLAHLLRPAEALSGFGSEPAVVEFGQFRRVHAGQPPDLIRPVELAPAAPRLRRREGGLDSFARGRVVGGEPLE